MKEYVTVAPIPGIEPSFMVGEATSVSTYCVQSMVAAAPDVMFAAPACGPDFRS